MSMMQVEKLLFMTGICAGVAIFAGIVAHELWEYSWGCTKDENQRGADHAMHRRTIVLVVCFLAWMGTFTHLGRFLFLAMG